jgi:hypothetical protein
MLGLKSAMRSPLADNKCCEPAVVIQMTKRRKTSSVKKALKACTLQRALDL